MSITQFTNVLSPISEAYNLLSKLKNVSDATCTRWIQVCDDTRNQFNTILTSADASVHERKNLQANVSQLCGYQEKFSQLSGRVTGTALSNNNLI